MRYIHVAGKATTSEIDYTPDIIQITGYCLYSLIEGLRQKNFSLLSLASVAESIQEYRDRYVEPVGGKLFADSGGYSIIAGEVHPQHISHFIQCYSSYLEQERDCYGRIFSLDIPWSKAYSSLNTKENIFAYNLESLSAARDIIAAHPIIRDKYHFVWQFKMPTQYEIWKRIYADLNLNEIVRHRAIGGMVGLRQATGIRFSPFNGMAFRCLWDFITAGDSSHPFTLHFLGMYLPADRFQIALLEGLARHNLAGQAAVEFTYDSVHHSHAARMSSQLPLHRFHSSGILETYSNLTSAPGDILDTVYITEERRDFAQAEIERRKNQERLLNSNSFAPLNVYSNVQLDRYFEHIVQEEPFVELMATESSLTKINHHLGESLKKLGKLHPGVFTRGLVRSIEENVQATFLFQHWLSKSKDAGKLDALMAEEIRQIGFPGDLA